jgi:pentatricopeptide repeat protein
MFKYARIARCAADGAVPPGDHLSAAASQLAQRLQAKARKDPSKSVKLIDRLKDLQLQGHWARAVSLFDNHPAEARQWRWQNFHYRCLLQLLLTAEQPAPVQRIWAEMKKRPELAVDEEGSNDALALACAGSDEALISDIQHTMEERKFDLKQRAIRGLERRRAMDWQAALREVKSRVDARVLEGRSVADDRDITATFEDLLRRHRTNRDAVAALTGTMDAAGVKQTAVSYAARIRAAPTWEAAMGAMAECKAVVPPTSLTYNALLQSLWAGRAASQMGAVIDDMAANNVAHDKRTVEWVMRYYETTPRWAEATKYFLSMKAAGVPPTNSGYGSLIKAYNRGGQADRVMTVFDAMRKDGFQGNERDTVSLINAWSSNRASRFRGSR